MPSYMYSCRNAECLAKFQVIRTIAEHESLRDTTECPYCGTQPSERIWDTPNVMNAASPDGYGQRNNSSYQKMKEAAKLEVVRASMAPDKRGDIDRAIRSLRRSDR